MAVRERLICASADWSKAGGGVSNHPAGGTLPGSWSLARQPFAYINEFQHQARSWTGTPAISSTSPSYT